MTKVLTDLLRCTNMEWTDKYRPDSLDDVRGNDDAIRDLRKWADNWESHRKAVVLHGRPGIGKTTAAHALANDHGWESIEMNASEQRTKDVVKKIAGGAANMGTLQGGVSGRRLVILDEADSLHGNHDRGGTGAMTDVVKEAEQPVVLVANEFYELSNGLRNNCKDIEFDFVDSSVIARFLRHICEEEGIAYTIDALRGIAEKADGDVRGAVNDLQAVAMNVEGELTVSDLPTGTRDRKENIFAYLDTLFQDGSPEEAHQAAQSVDETPDNLFQWVEDNIVKEYKGDELWQAYSFLARADEWLGRVYSSDHNYKYWKYANDQMTAGVASSRKGHHSGWTRWGPPSFWQKLGSTRGKRNTRDSIARRIAENSAVSMETAKDEVLPFLSAITHHCKNRDVTVAMAAIYELNEKEVSFITGSGKTTNKVEGIVEDAQDLRSEAAIVEASGMHERVDEDVTERTGVEEPSSSDENDDEDDGAAATLMDSVENATDDEDSDDDGDGDDVGHTQTTLF